MEMVLREDTQLLIHPSEWIKEGVESVMKKEFLKFRCCKNIY